MKFGSIFTIGTLCITGLVNAAPTSVNRLDQRDDLDVESLIKAIEEFSSLDKRDDNAFVNSLVSSLGSSYISSLVDQLSENPEFKKFMSSGAISSITDGKYNATYVLSLLEDDDLIPNLLSSVFLSNKHRRDTTELVQRMWSEGLLSIDESHEVTKRETKVSSQSASVLSKRDSEYISTIVDKLSSSNLLSSLSNGLLNSNNLKVAEDYLKKSLSNVDVDQLVESLKNSKVGSLLINELKDSDFLQEQFSKFISANIKRGLIARADVTDLSSSAAPATTAEGLLDQLFDNSDTTTVTTSSSSSAATSAPTSSSSLSSGSSASTTKQGLLDALFGSPTTTSSSSRSATNSASATTSEGFLDKLLGNTGKTTNSTSSSARSTSTGESFADLLGDLFKPSNSSSTKTSSSAKATSTADDFSLAEFLDDLLGGSSSSNSTRSSGSSSSGSSLSDIISNLLDDIFGGSSSSSSSSGPSTSLSEIFGNLIDSVFNWLFGGDGQTGIFSNLIKRFLNWLFSSDSTGSGTNFGSLISSALDWLIDALFDGDGSSSSSSSSSTKSTTTTAKQCCCNKKSKMVKKRELKEKLKRNLHNHLRKRANDFDFASAELYIKYL